MRQSCGEEAGAAVAANDSRVIIASLLPLSLSSSKAKIHAPFLSESRADERRISVGEKASNTENQSGKKAIKIIVMSRLTCLAAAAAASVSQSIRAASLADHGTRVSE